MVDSDEVTKRRHPMKKFRFEPSKSHALLLITLLVLTTLVAVSRAHLGKVGTQDPLPADPPVVEVAGSAPGAQQVPTAVPPRIEVVFVLDTTGSMSGLIEGAKKKIWSVANRMLDGEPRPDVRLGLVGYRDRGDDYVTQQYDLSDDVDSIYAHLMAFQAGGGGDTPESVNQALHEAVSAFDWSEDPSVYRVIFLVGDAPPHMDYQDDVPYQQSLAQARERGILVNTVQCGGLAETREVWADIARFGEGRFVAIAQDGGMKVTSTPMDTELSRLNHLLAETVVPWGNKTQQRELRAKKKRALEADEAVVSERLSYLSKKGGVVNSGRYDLVDALGSGKVKLEDVEKEALPVEFQALSGEELSSYVAKQSKQRAELKRQVGELVATRDAYLREKAKRKKVPGESAGFDEEVVETLRTQAASKGIEY
jgi:uncharacterized protein YegL